jgi:hypothetical protein
MTVTVHNIIAFYGFVLLLTIPSIQITLTVQQVIVVMIT